jgi:DNA-binding NarL/FixJ family response regulator
MKLLILEDEPIVSMALEECLKPHWPWQIHVTESCNEALFALSGPHYFPVFLSDVQLPDGNGLDLIKIAAERGSLAFSEVALITACAVKDNVVKAKQVGVAHFLVKPFDPQVVGKIIANVVQVLNSRNQVQGMTVYSQEYIELSAYVLGLNAKTLTERELDQLVNKSTKLNLNTLAQAALRIRSYLVRHYRRESEIADALVALHTQTCSLAN